MSLRNRVALTVVAVLGIGVVALTLAVNLAVGVSLDRQANDTLRTRAQAAAATVYVAEDGTVSVLDTANDAALDTGIWVLAGTKVLQRPAGGKALDTLAARVGGGEGPVQTGGRRGTRWFAEPVVVDGSQVATVVSSLSMEPYAETQRLVLIGTSALALILLFAVWLALRAGVGRALRPVADMTHQSARWSADDVDRRFGAERRPAELEDLALTLDGVLDRLSAVLRHEQRLSSELSHELRTPIARILAEAELMRGHEVSPAARDEALSTIADSAQEMSDILEILMTAAKSTARATPGRCALGPVLERIAASRRSPLLQIEVHGAGDVTVGVEAVVVERALGPIMDNAVRFARTRIDVDVSDGRSTVRVDVLDDGPGIAEDAMTRVFEPGWRDEGQADHEGAGLGLSLARRLLEASGGSVCVSPSSSGACLTIFLPSA